MSSSQFTLSFGWPQVRAFHFLKYVNCKFSSSSLFPSLQSFPHPGKKRGSSLTTSEVYFSNLHSLIDILALVLVHCNFFSQTEQSRKVEAPAGNDHDLRDPQGKKAENRNESERWKTPSDLRELFCRRTKWTPVDNPRDRLQIPEYYIVPKYSGRHSIRALQQFIEPILLPVNLSFFIGQITK